MRGLVIAIIVSFYLATAVSLQSSTKVATISSAKNGFRKSTKGLKSKGDEDLDEATKKYGLEYGVFKAFSSNNTKVKPQELLAKYGAAYLVTSISLATVSYATCYVLVSNGIDIGALLNKVGIQVTDASSTAGTAGIAYVFHKAASPIRFPPTVALTPVVAGWLGKKPSETLGEKK